MCTTAQAQERGWTGAGGTSDWFGPNNWSTSSIPAAGAATSIGSNTPSGAAPNATVIIGAGTAAQTNTLEIGRTTGATGTLTVERGASLNAGTAAITLGRQGTGFLNIAGGTVSASTLGIGSPNGTLAGGTGVLQINGGVLNTTLTGNVNNIGFETPGSSVLIDGAGSGWNAASDIIVGNNGGSALLTVQNGGMLNVTSTNLDLGLADEQNSTGTLTIDGPGSTVVSGAGITVGIEGTGYVSVLNGATLQTGAYGLDFDYIGLVGQPPSAGGYQSEGHVVVDGRGSSWTSSTGIMVGYEGIGTLTVSNGASVVSPLSYIGAIRGYIGSELAPLAGHGEVLITGENSIWSASALDIAAYNGAEGTLTVSEGGTLRTTTSAGIRLGNGGPGVINIGSPAGQGAVAPVSLMRITFSLSTRTIA